MPDTAKGSTSAAERCDTVVIGAGPAGSAAAATLAMRGRNVVVVERETFPRYHIGESLMPFCYFPLERIGALERVRRSSFPKKYAVQFVSVNGRASQPFYFFQHRDHPSSQTWQVLRSEFDLILMENARRVGAKVWEATEARELIVDRGAVLGVRYRRQDGTGGELRAPITIDASGRDSLAQLRMGWRVRDPYLAKVAIWTYFQGAKRDPGLDEGTTTVAYLPERGWFWYIPLPDDVVSVGIVAEKEYLYRDTRDLPEIFCREVGNNEWIKEHLAPGRQVGEYRVTGEFSYRSRHCASDGLVLAGDAFAFLDPVFSSGVFLALRSGEMAAESADSALGAGDVSAGRFEAYGDELCRGIESMRKLVYAFYDQAFSFKELVMEYPDLRGRLTDCLIGDLFSDFGELFGAVARFARVPPPLPYGKPILHLTEQDSRALRV
jgi:flavin-dependent dehydrogenase